MDNIKTLKEAKTNGYYCIVLLIGATAIQFALTSAFPNESMLLTIVSSITVAIITYTYWKVLRGIAVLASESGNEQFVASTKNFIHAVLITSIATIATGFMAELDSELLALLGFIISAASILYLGVVSIKISNGFKTLVERLGKTAHRTSFWHKVSGYLMVSIILSPIGILASLIADYFMWRLVSLRLNEHTNVVAT